MSISKLLSFKSGNPEKPRILILAPTGVAAINIDGTMIHTALGINVGHKLYPFNDRQRGMLRNKLSEIKLIIIDEISIVSSMLFYQVHQRLNEIFEVSRDLPFAGSPVLVCGDLYQLPPVKGAPIYSSTDNTKGYLSLELWNNFKIVELTEVMRHRGDLELISFLNKIRVGIVGYKGEKISLSRFIAKDNPEYPKHALHMFTENKLSVDCNELMLNEILGEVISINAIDEVPQEIHLSDKQTETIVARKIGGTGNLASVLNLKVGAQVMLTININLEDRLANGLVGKVMYLRYVNDEVKVINVKFNDHNPGQQAIQSDIFARQRNSVPV